MPRIPVPDFLLRTLSRQLSGPSGVLGGFVARMLNKGNAGVIAAAVEALELSGGERVADIGFGGGLGLDLLLDAVGQDGRVYGVEPSPDMLARARRMHDDDLESGRLELDETTMDRLPFPDEALDGWISLNTVYFIEELAPALAELHRVLAPSGRAVLGIADPDWMATQPFTRHEFTIRPVDDVAAALRDVGLDVEQRRVGGGARAYRLLVCSRARS
ncbi:methyltransferase domain-containing protein [Nocardioides panacisoli]|uniref:Methyltransferase type 11 domain-containing protein n=1 Tax=Nocardioides panacisoli TaxID=627624 RepID=A0ABP7I6T5_9ACTN